MIIYRDIFDEVSGVTTKTPLHDIEVDDKTELRQGLSGLDLVDSTFTSEGTKLDIRIGDYIEFKDSVYTILDEPSIRKEQNTFTYKLEFKSDQYRLKNVQLINPDTTEGEFFLFGTPIDHVSLIISNMNRVYNTGAVYFADYVEQRPGKNIGYKDENCLAALQKIASEFGCEFAVKGKMITFREKVGQETDLVLQYHKELRGIYKKNLPNAELITVLYPYGSTRNLTHGYGSKRLRIPKLEKNKEIFGTIERAVVFEDIYPRLKGVVSEAKDYKSFADTNIDFDINDQLIGGVKAMVVFNTGDLAGRELEIKRYTHSTKTIELIPYTDETDLTVPNEILKPRVGDKYVLIGIEMPQTYIDNAEAELLEKATAYLDKYSLPNVVYNVDTHYPELRRRQLHFNIGDVVTISDADFGISFQTRILSLTQKLNNPFEYTLELGSQVTVSYITKVLDDQKEIRNEIYFNGQYYIERLNRVYNNVASFTQAVYVNMGEFDPKKYYYNNQNRIDYVFRYDINGDKEWYAFQGQDHSRGEWIEANWRFLGRFEVLATETILAENANIGHWLIQNGQIVSQAMYVGETEAENEPRVRLNATAGYIRLVSPVMVYGDAGYRQYKQTIMLDSRTGAIESHREGDLYQEPASASFSSNGVTADFSGIDVESPAGAIPHVIGKGAIVGEGKGKMSAPLWARSFNFIAGVVGKAINTATDNSYTDGPVASYGGAFWALKSWGRYVGVVVIDNNDTSYNIGKYDELITCYNLSTCEIFLPSKPITGRKLSFRKINEAVIIRKTDMDIRTDVNRTFIELNVGRTCTLIFDGKYWIADGY